MPVATFVEISIVIEPHGCLPFCAYGRSGRFYKSVVAVAVHGLQLLARPRCIAGITFSVAILATPSTPHRIFAMAIGRVMREDPAAQTVRTRRGIEPASLCERICSPWCCYA